MKVSGLFDLFPPLEIWVLGAGRFGRLAVQRLGERHPGARITAVDAREEQLIHLREDFGVAIQVEDAISFLAGETIPDEVWIIPAVPVHVAFRWLLVELSKAGSADPLVVPDAVDSVVPNPYRVVTGSVYTSFATFLCPDFCNEPDEICTYTQKPRPGNLFERLSQMAVPGFETLVIRSWQLAPGVGGYPANHLKNSLQDISRSPGSYLVATSCRCHGVIDALRWVHAR
jgi:hypothetical protein